jgi:hypothetical protein
MILVDLIVRVLKEKAYVINTRETLGSVLDRAAANS